MKARTYTFIITVIMALSLAGCGNRKADISIDIRPDDVKRQEKEQEEQDRLKLNKLAEIENNVIGYDYDKVMEYVKLIDTFPLNSNKVAFYEEDIEGKRYYFVDKQRVSKDEYDTAIQNKVDKNNVDRQEVAYYMISGVNPDTIANFETSYEEAGKQLTDEMNVRHDSVGRINSVLAGLYVYTDGLFTKDYMEEIVREIGDTPIYNVSASNTNHSKLLKNIQLVGQDMIESAEKNGDKVSIADRETLVYRIYDSVGWKRGIVTENNGRLYISSSRPEKNAVNIVLYKSLEDTGEDWSEVGAYLESEQDIKEKEEGVAKALETLKSEYGDLVELERKEGKQRGFYWEGRVKIPGDGIEDIEKELGELEELSLDSNNDGVVDEAEQLYYDINKDRLQSAKEARENLSETWKNIIIFKDGEYILR